MVDINKLSQAQDGVSGFDVAPGLLERDSFAQGFNEDANVEPDYRTEKEKTQDAFMYALPNTVIGGISEVAESMPGVDGADAEALVQSLTTEGMYRDFKEKEDGYKLGGALLTSMVPIFGMQKLMRSKSLYTKMEMF